MSNNTKYLSYDGLSHYTDKLKGYFAEKEHNHEYLSLSGSTLTGDLVLKNSAAGDTPKLIFQRGDISSDSANTDTYIDYDIYNTEGKLTFSSHDKDADSVGRKNTLFSFNRDKSTYTFYASFKTSVTLDAPTEDSDTPALIFKRGTFTDGWYDHKIYNSAGALKFQYSNAGTDIDILSLAKTTSKLSSGLTLTGETSDTARISFSRTTTSGTTWNYITAPVGGNIVIAPHGINTSSETGYHFGAANLYPGKTNTYSLGTDTLKWKNVYATTFTGALNGNASSATKLSSTAISFTPAETALTPDEVYTLVGGTTIKRGTWYYAGNGYISNDTTGVGTINLAGTTVIQADNGSSNYTQLYLTPSTGSIDGCKTNEIFMYNNNGSNYRPSWTRVLTNRNYTDYCLPLSGGKMTGTITSQSIIPAANNTYYLGSADYKWTNVYATTFTGEKVKTGRVDFNDYAITNASTQPNLFLAAIEPTSTTNLCTQKIFRFALTGQGTVDYGNCKINKQYAATNMWVAGDTFGYISMPYLESDKANVYIGGGNRKGNSWSSKLLLDSDKITPDEIDDMFEDEFGIKF